MNKCKILSTKKLPAAFYSALPPHVELQVTEFISIQPLPRSDIQEKFSQLDLTSKKLTLVFTSNHAVIDIYEQLLKNQQLATTRIYCLGGATMEAVKQKLPDIFIAAVADNAGQLAKKIIAAGVTEAVFFCGNKRRDELPDLLQENGVKVHELIVYNTVLKPVSIDGEPDAVLFFSPSAVESFFSVNALAAGATCIAIGETTATSIRELTGNDIIICHQPSKSGMLAAIKEFTSKKENE